MGAVALLSAVVAISPVPPFPAAALLSWSGHRVFQSFEFWSFQTGVIPKSESKQAIQLESWPNLVSVSANQRGKVGIGNRVLGLVT